MAKKEKGSGTKKYDRNRPWCQAYRNRQQRERNKVVKLLRHFRRFGYSCAATVHCYNNLPMNLKPRDMLTAQRMPSKSELRRMRED